MKKTLSLIFVLIICILPLQAFALEEEMIYEKGTASFEDVVYLNQMFEISLFSSQDDLETRYEKAKQTLLNGVKNRQQMIDIFEYKIPIELGTSLFSDIFFYNPELFYINNGYGIYRYKHSPEYVAVIDFEYVYSPSEYASRKIIFDNEVQKITSLIKPTMSELEKALIVHDYVDLNCEYDTTPIGTDEDGNAVYKDSSFRADGIIVDKVGVCQSYSMAYYYIMNLLGVEADYVESKAMNHMWNIFRIGDNWYHVDSTWDDPVPDEYAYVSHQHFLASDNLMRTDSNSHHNWVAKHECTDTSFDDHFWRNINGSIALDGEGKAYYHTWLKSSSGTFPYYYFEILSHNLKTHETQVLKTEARKYWYVWGTQTFTTRVYSDVSFYNGKLYYNTPTEIIEINTDGSGENIIARYNQDDGYIYGSKLKDYLLLFGVEQHPEYECDKTEHQLTEYYTSLENRIGVKPVENNPVDIEVSVLRKYLDYKNMPGKIIATLYDENDIVKETKMLTLSECNINNSNTYIPIDFDSQTGEYIKLMWWDMETLSPISKNIKYPIQ